MHIIRALVVFVLCGAAAAQDYPARPVRVIIASTAGSLTDTVARLMAQRITQVSKHPAIAENRVGGGGTIAGEFVAKAPADGHTLLGGFHGLNAILPALGAKMSFDSMRDFTPVFLFMTVPNVLTVHPAVPAKNVAELIALARAKPGSLTFASQGTGSSGHLSGELFRLAAGIDIVHVPYRGPPEAVRDLLSGEVTMMFDVVPFALSNIRAGKVRPIALATRERVAAVADVPTMPEAGFPTVEGGAWFALFVHAKTPRSIIDWLNREANIAFSEPTFRERYISQGAAIPLGTPEDAQRFVAAEFARWTQVGRSACVRLE